MLIMPIPRGFIPIVNSGDELKRKSVLTRISLQTPANCISELFYNINRPKETLMSQARGSDRPASTPATVDVITAPARITRRGK